MLIRSILLSLSLITTAANAAIISGSQTTDGGKTVNLSGLEWLSFDDATLSTFDVTYATIADASSAWSLDGWRYASSTEVNDLWTSLGLSSGSFSSNEDGVDFIFNNWGGVYNPPAVYYPGDLIQTFSENWVIEAMFGDGAGGEADSLFLQTDFSVVNERNGSVVSSSNFENTAGFAEYIPLDELFNPGIASFLVREGDTSGGEQPPEDTPPVSVPEPASFTMLALGIVSLLSIRSMRA